MRNAALPRGATEDRATWKKNVPAVSVGVGRCRCRSVSVDVVLLRLLFLVCGKRFSDLFHDASAVSVSVCVSEELCDLFADVLCENFE